MPPVSRLTNDQAMYHFLSGYTAKIAGTEAGITEPKATFSTCFAAPFLPRSPMVYAEMLGERLRRHGSQSGLAETLSKQVVTIDSWQQGRADAVTVKVQS